MDIFGLLNLIGGLSLFLFGMNIMGPALQRLAHEIHAEQKQAQPAQHGQRMKNIHFLSLNFTFSQMSPYCPSTLYGINVKFAGHLL